MLEHASEKGKDSPYTPELKEHEFYVDAKNRAMQAFEYNLQVYLKKSVDKFVNFKEGHLSPHDDWVSFMQFFYTKIHDPYWYAFDLYDAPHPLLYTPSKKILDASMDTVRSGTEYRKAVVQARQADFDLDNLYKSPFYREMRQVLERRKASLRKLMSLDSREALKSEIIKELEVVFRPMMLEANRVYGALFDELFKRQYLTRPQVQALQINEEEYDLSFIDDEFHRLRKNKGAVNSEARLPSQSWFSSAIGMGVGRIIDRVNKDFNSFVATKQEKERILSRPEMRAVFAVLLDTGKAYRLRMLGDYERGELQDGRRLEAIKDEELQFRNALVQYYTSFFMLHSNICIEKERLSVRKNTHHPDCSR